jgi:hypothetical protein
MLTLLFQHFIDYDQGSYPGKIEFINCGITVYAYISLSSYLCTYCVGSAY